MAAIDLGADGGSGHYPRQPGQAHPRIQAAAPQCVAHRRALQPLAGEPDDRDDAASVPVRGQGGAGLPPGEADHQILEQPRRDHRRRSDHTGSAQGPVPARVQRVAGRAADPRHGCFQPDLDRRLRGQRHEQHEVHDERCLDGRHARRRDDRDGARGRGGELLPLRVDRGAGRRQPRLVQPALALRPPAGDARGAGPDLLRPLQPQRAGHLRAAARRHAHLRRLLYAPPGPRVLSGSRREALRAVRGPGRVGAHGHPERGQLRKVLERSHYRRVRGRHLARHAVPGGVMEPAMIHDMKEAASISPLAGKPAPKSLLVDLVRLEREYYERKPDLDDPTQLVSFGTSGHRGSSLRGSFTEAHIAAITQAICDYRRARGIDGPLFMGKDTHALSDPAQRTALEVLAANGVETIIQRDAGVTPTPVISWAILVYNRGRKEHLADGIVVTPSHNPPEDGGFKYNPPNGGPADLEATRWIQDRANDLLRVGNAGVNRLPFASAFRKSTTHEQDFVLPYVRDLGNVVDLDVIRESGLELGVDPLGGASKPVWEAIGAVHKILVAVVNPAIDPTFSFMTVDHDGKIRTDPSSPYAMARVVALKDKFQVVVAND